jgi:prepilin-type N-terminal cleavage/methylation domain-containing protein
LRNQQTVERIRKRAKFLKGGEEEMKRIICQFSVLPCWCWKGGLTLIELVVVCAIIAMLVGIVWVVMAPAREKARQAVCISNLTQIGHAFRMYRDD